MLELLAHYIISFIESTSYFGIFILMGLESALIPIPSEVTMPFSGYLVSTGELNFWVVVIVGTLANLAGSLVAYYIGYLIEETILVKLINKYGKFVLISETEYRHAEHWFQKYGDKIIFISRLLPGIRTVISLPAGAFRMDIKKFVVYTTAGCLLWSALLTYVGMYMGENWHALEPYYRKFEIVVVLGIIIAVLWYVDHKLQVRKKLTRAKH